MRVNSRAPLIIPILIMVVGTGWLLTVQGFSPGVNWIWTLSLGVVGILTFVVSGVDKVSIVIGPFFLLASILSVLRQTGHLELDVEVPVLVIAIGALLLIAYFPIMPKPAWLVPLPPPSEEPSEPKRMRLGANEGAADQGQ
jgi:hypothetical protein